MTTQNIIDAWESGVEPYNATKELETVADSLNQCSAIRSAKQLREVAGECEERLRKLHWFQIGQNHRKKGLPCSYTNGSYLDGWYSPTANHNNTQ